MADLQLLTLSLVQPLCSNICNQHLKQISSRLRFIVILHDRGKDEENS